MTTPEVLESRQSLTPFFIACCVFLLLMECLGVSTSKNLRLSTDFRQFYGAGVMVRTEPANLYDLDRQKQVQDALISPQALVMPAVHPSYEALFYSPFTLLKYRTAYLTFIAFNVALLVAVFFAAQPVFSASIPWLQAKPGLIFFLFMPLIVAVWQGQDSILFLLVCCCSWRQLRTEKYLSAGCILALGFFRFHMAIPIAVLTAARLIWMRKDWRFAAGFTATTVAIAGLCVAITGRAATMAMIQVMRAFTLSGDQGAVTQNLLGIRPLSMPNLRGLLYAFGTGHLPPHLAFEVLAVVSVGLFFVCGWRLLSEPRDSVAFSVAVLCIVLISDHLYMHDETLLLLPIALLARQVPPLVPFLCYVLPAVLFFLFGANWFFHTFYSYAGIIGLRSKSPRNCFDCFAQYASGNTFVYLG